MVSRSHHRTVFEIRHQAGESCGFASPALLLLICLFITPVVLLSTLSFQENVLSKKVLLKKKAFHLAEYAIWEWLARSGMGFSGFRPDDENHFSADGSWISSRANGSWEGGSYLSWGEYKEDDYDLDGRPDTTIVLYNREFGYSSSPFEEGGYPVIDIHSRGTFGSHAVSLVASVSNTVFSPLSTAALTAGGRLTIIGDALVDGRPGDLPPGGESEPYPGISAVAAAGPLETEGDVILIDAPGSSPAIIEPGITLAGPYAILGKPPASLLLEKRADAENTSLPFEGITCFKEDYSGVLKGSGIVIVHNPQFDPERYLASYRYSLGLESPGYDPSYSHLDPANRPAVLEPSGDSLFLGILIADDFRPGSGSLKVLGQMFLLNPLGVDLGMSEGVVITYGPATTRKYAHGDIDNILSWKVDDPE